MMEVERDSLSTVSADKVSTSGDESRAAKKNFKSNLLRTAFDGCAVVFLGMQASQKGPSFLDLQLISGTSVEGASTYFTASSFGYMVGSLVAGFLYDRIGNKVTLICIPLTFGAFFIGLTPHCTSYITMLLAHIVASIQCALPETTTTAEQLRMWHGKSDTALQFLSFAYSLGGVIGPLYTEPFLAPTNKVTNMSSSTQPHNNFTEFAYNASNKSVNMSQYILELGENQTISTPMSQPKSELKYAYMITGLFGIAFALPFYFLMIKSCSKRTSEKQQAENVKTPQRKLCLKTYIILAVTASIFVFFYTMTEDCFNMFLSMFLVSHLSWSKESGALISSLYWGIGTVSKLVVTCLSRRLKLGKIMLSSCLSMVFSLIAFLIASHFHINVLIWISTSCFAISQASVFGGCFSWVDSNILKMDGKVTSVVMIFASLGAMTGPLVLGTTMNNISLMAFPVIELINSVILFLHFLFMFFLLKPYVASHYGSPKKGKIIDMEIEITEEKKDMISDSDDVTIVGKNGSMKDSNLI